jgi:hypothetical protein
VPEVVPADGGEARCFEERFEVAIDHVLGVEGVPVRVAKMRSKSP